MDVASTFPHVVIADRTVLHASIAIGGIDVIAGKLEESGVTDATAATFITNVNGVDDMSIVTIGGNA